MSKNSRKIAAALRQPAVLDGIAQLFVRKMRKHIDDNYGRGQNGESVAHKPLKDIFGWYKGKQVAGYRNGGQPLRNTGEMYRHLQATGSRTARGLSVTLVGPKYALYQDRGFKTSKPNFIPLSRSATSKHATGADPNTEGLVRGRDYFMARRGVTVPSRPFLLPTRDEMREVGISIFMSLKSILKGK